jgi:hypothetical protein
LESIDLADDRLEGECSTGRRAPRTHGRPKPLGDFAGWEQRICLEHTHEKRLRGREAGQKLPRSLPVLFFLSHV